MFFFFNDTATTEIYTLSLHDALPIFDNVYDPNTTRFQIIGNHRTMAAPPDCLRAHDRDRADFVHAIEKAFHASVKLLRLHAIGVTAKGSVSPGRFRSGFSPSV